MAAALDGIAAALDAIVVLLQKKKAPRKEYDSFGAEQMRQVWNQFTPDELPRVKELLRTSTRGRNASARWLEKPDREYWAKVALTIGRTKFCLGDNDRGWKADFEFFVRPDTHLKIMEGKYDNLHKSRTTEPKKATVVGYLPDGTPIYSNK